MDADTKYHQCSCELCQPGWGGVTAALNREDESLVPQQRKRKRTEDTKQVAPPCKQELVTG
jgi:hypothetical protein